MEFDQRKKCCSNRKDAKRLFPEEIWNDLHFKSSGTESIRLRLEFRKDIITHRKKKSVLDKYHKNKTLITSNK
jgi:hypothetical protein